MSAKKRLTEQEVGFLWGLERVGATAGCLEVDHLQAIEDRRQLVAMLRGLAEHCAGIDYEMADRLIAEVES